MHNNNGLPFYKLKKNKLLVVSYRTEKFALSNDFPKGMIKILTQPSSQRT